MDLTSYLAQLADSAARLSISRLKALSNLSAEDAVRLRSSWPAIDVRRRRRIVHELLDLAEDNVDLNFDRVFIVALDDADADVRAGAVRGLWEHEGTDVIPALARLATEDESAEVRAEAALGLGRFVLMHELGRLRERHFRDVETALRAILDRQDEIAEVQGRALEAIGPHDAPWVRQAIRAAYESGTRRLKVSAVHAMGRSCEERWLPLVARELSSEEPEIRYEAALACAAIGDSSTVSQLARLLEDPDDEVREAAIAALGAIGGDEARAILSDLLAHASETIREAARDALSEIDFEEDPLSFRHRLS